MRRKFFSMSLEDERNAIDHARRCQRNWDFTKPVLEEHIEHWIYLATHAPSKQDESFFDLYVVTDREKLDYLWRHHSYGFTMLPGVTDHVAPNPQMGAPVVFVYNKKMPEEVRNNNKDGSIADVHISPRVANSYASVGISMGIVAQSANLLGYRTGFGKNFDFKESPKDSGHVWGEMLGIPEEENQITYSLGIGYPIEGLPWNESVNNEEYLTGGPVNWKERTAPRSFRYSRYSTLERDIKVTRI